MPNTCPICLNSIVGEICGFHTTKTVKSSWAKSNRIWNDVLMRGVPFPKRVKIGLEDLTN